MFIRTICCLLTAGSLFASNISKSNPKVGEKSEVSFLDQNYSFKYITIGNFLLPPFPEVTVGIRCKRESRGFDTSFGIGVAGIGNRAFMGISFLEYLRNEGFYIGWGCDMNLVLLAISDDPFSVFPLPTICAGRESSRRFHQIKFILPVPSVFYSYGFKF